MRPSGRKIVTVGIFRMDTFYSILEMCQYSWITLCSVQSTLLLTIVLSSSVDSKRKDQQLQLNWANSVWSMGNRRKIWIFRFINRADFADLFPLQRSLCIDVCTFKKYDAGLLVEYARVSMSNSKNGQKERSREKKKKDSTNRMRFHM